jgi:hypothetical protein
MNQFMFTASLFTILSISLSSIGKDTCKEKIVKYVQGGACKLSKGTKKHPYRTLVEAEADTSWDVLIVLPSSMPLDGGISLRDGTKLIGVGDPTKRIPSSELSIITNSSGRSNGGNGAVVNGKATIENIYFKDTFAAGIEYSLGTDLVAKHILVTGHNSGNPDSTVGGINSVSSISGKVCIKNSVVRNVSNTLGRGMRDRALSGARRQVLISKCEVSDLANIGIFISADGLNSFFSAEIEDTFVHDINSEGCRVQTTANGTGKAFIKNSSFRNITGVNIFEATFAGTFQDLHVRSCDFSNTDQFTVFPPGLVLSTEDSTGEVVFDNCHMSRLGSVLYAITYDKTSASTQKIKIENCMAENMSVSLFVADNSSATGLFPRTEVVIEDINYVGRRGIVVLPRNKWDLLDITMKHSCLTAAGLATSTAFLTNRGPAGNATIRAHNNSINGFAFDINDLGSNVTYQVQKNWWGAAKACTANGECGPYQICSDSMCLGPNKVVNVGSGPIHANDPLPTSIKCQGISCKESGLAVQNLSLPLEVNSQAEEEMIALPMVEAVE